MKVTIHIKNDGYFCHPAISAIAELPEAPQVGDCVYLSRALALVLEEDIEVYTKKWSKDDEIYCADYHECTDKTGCSLEEYIYCVGRAFYPAEGEYNRFDLHIELGKSEHLNSKKL